MDVRCPECQTLYEFDEARIKGRSVNLKCSQCGHIFKVQGPKKTPDKDMAGARRRWMVRNANTGDILYFTGMSTLQKWIIDRKVSRNDEISKTGKTWKTLGEIVELASFFQVAESIQRLQDGGQPEPLRSAVASPISPIAGSAPSELPPEPATEQLPVQEKSAPVDAPLPPPPKAEYYDPNAPGEAATIPPGAKVLTGVDFDEPKKPFADRKPMDWKGESAKTNEWSAPEPEIDRSAPVRETAEVMPSRKGKLTSSPPRVDTTERVKAPTKPKGKATPPPLKQPAAKEPPPTPPPPTPPSTSSEGALEIDMANELAAPKPLSGFGGTLDDDFEFASEPSSSKAPLIIGLLVILLAGFAGYVWFLNPALLDTVGLAHLKGGETLEVDAGSAETETDADTETTTADNNDAGTEEADVAAVAEPEKKEEETPKEKPETKKPKEPAKKVVKKQPDADDRAPSGSYDGLMSQAKRALRAGRGSKALQAYKAAAKANPRSVQAVGGQGWAHLSMGNANGAVAAFKQALKIYPRYGDAMIGLGQAYRQLGNSGEAIKAYKQYLSIYPNGPKASIARYQVKALGGTP